MRKALIYLNLTFIIFTFSCNKEKYLSTTIIKGCGSIKLYVERYQVGWIHSNYLTDSISFRKFIGLYDFEHEIYFYDCRNDSIYITKIETGSKNCHEVTLKNGVKKIECDRDTIEQKVFKLSTLQKQHKFE